MILLKMRLLITTFRFITKVALICSVLICNVGFSQEIIPDEEKKPTLEPKAYVPDQDGKIKADGVAAVIGEYIILDSDLDREISQFKAQGADLEEITRCQIFGSLLESKLYAHQAIQDSILPNELFIRSNVDQKFDYLLNQFGGDSKKMLAFYKKDSDVALKDEMYEYEKSNYLTKEMRTKVIKEVEITPEEVRTFFNSIPEDERPTFGTELKVAQIVVIPEVTQAAKQAAIDELKGYKKDVENGASFTTKALFYSDDLGSKNDGGKLPTMNRKRPQMVKEFRDVAFSLQEGEISDPFKTDFGYHIVFLEKIRGQEYEIRHILVRPEITPDAIKKAKDQIEEVRQKISEGKVSFADAAREFSDEEETKFEGGQLTNPTTQDFNFELTRMEPELYSQIQNLKDGEISQVYQDEDRVNRIKFKILTVTDRIDEHEANYAKDYLKIKALALQDKQLDVIGKWQEKTIIDTYIKVNGEYRNCDFEGNWLKNQ